MAALNTTPPAIPDDADDRASVSTLDVDDLYGPGGDSTAAPFCFGEPLERMEKDRVYVPIDRDVLEGWVADATHAAGPLLKLRSQNLVVESDYFNTVHHPDNTDDYGYEELDRLIRAWQESVPARTPEIVTTPNFVAYSRAPTSKTIRKRVNNAEELRIWMRLSGDSLRRDPWNPLAPVIGVLNSSADPASKSHSHSKNIPATLLLEPLHEVDIPKGALLVEILDLVREVLQGIAFLHEHDVALGSLDVRHMLMEVGNAPLEKVWGQAQHDVRYYFTDLSESTLVTNLPKSQRDTLFAKDIAQAGRLLEHFVANKKSSKLDNLTRLMTDHQTAHEALEKLAEAKSDLPSDLLLAPLVT